MTYGMQNRDIREHMDNISSSTMSRIFKRLRLHGLIERAKGTFKYFPTALGKSVIAAGLTVKNLILIFLDSLDTKRNHVLQMMIPKYLSRLFAEHPLSDDESALLKSLGGKSHAEYERLIEQFAQRLDMRSEIIRTRL